MHCIRPLKAGFTSSGDITFSTRNADQSQVGFQLECRKCLPCRLNIAREKAVRCYHQAQMHEDNIFLTLTYNDEHLSSPKLVYQDWQNFAKKLRQEISYETSERISYMVTGEYGDKNKRPHWHAIIFNFSPKDKEYKYRTELGEVVYGSERIARIWGKGLCEFGSVTLESAGYVARYASKKLIHGRDGTHEYDPIHKTSSRRAIGRTWIENHYQHTFGNGFIVLPNGQKSKIPRYYVDWAKKFQPDLWHYYVTKKRPEIQAEMEKIRRREELDYFTQLWTRKHGDPMMQSRNSVKETILNQKFKQLQERLKL